MDFSDSIKRFAEAANKNVLNVRRAVGMKLFSAVILDTPVDTGRLRGNWQASVGSPKEGQVGVRSAADATNEVTQAVLSVHGDQALILRNNLPYAYRIEYEGWSHTKAPAGMMRINIARFDSLLGEAVRKIRAGEKATT